MAKPNSVKDLGSPLDTDNPHANEIRPPQAWIIGRGNPQGFTVSERGLLMPQSPSELRGGGSFLQTNFQSSLQNPVDMEAYRISQAMARDDVAREQFRTTWESSGHPEIKQMWSSDSDTDGFYTSVHHMSLGGEQNQEFHYHPSTHGFVRASDRLVIFVPLGDASAPEDAPPEERGGIHFSWFDTTQDNVLTAEETGTIPILEGTPRGKQYDIYVPPGTIGVVRLDVGAHRFSGLGAAISMHPLDKLNERVFEEGHLVGNTVGYSGDRPQETEQISVNEKMAIDLHSGVHLGAVFSHLDIMATHLIQAWDPRDMFSVEAQEHMVRQLGSALEPLGLDAERNRMWDAVHNAAERARANQNTQEAGDAPDQVADL